MASYVRVCSLELREREINWNLFQSHEGPDSVVGIATGYRLDGPNPGGVEIYPTCQDWPWGPPNFLYNGYRLFPGRKERPGRDTDPSLPSNAVVVKE
jgi:hypothetical protein